eukprot:1174898-Amphidinium_carterae.2
MPKTEPLATAGELRVAMRAIYGSIDAGRQLYLHFREILKKFGVQEIITEPGLHVYRDASQQPIPVFHSHVDDALVAIDGSSGTCASTLEGITEERNTSGRYVVQQTLNIDNLGEPKIADDDDSQRALSPEKISRYRFLVGQWLWYSRCALLELYEQTIRAARAMKYPCLHHLLGLVKLARQYQGYVVQIVFLSFFVYVDASFANAGNDSSVIGHYIGMAPGSHEKQILAGYYATLAPLSWGASTTRRVHTVSIHIFTDSGSLAAAVQSKRQDMVSHDKRARTAIKHLQQMLDDSGEAMTLRWIPTYVQIADLFTKAILPTLLKKAVSLTDARDLMLENRDHKNRRLSKKEKAQSTKLIHICCYGSERSGATTIACVERGRVDVHCYPTL